MNVAEPTTSLSIRKNAILAIPEIIPMIVITMAIIQAHVFLFKSAHADMKYGIESAARI